MRENILENFEYTWEIKVNTKKSLEEIADALIRAEEEVRRFIEHELEVRLLEPPMDIELMRERDDIVIIKLNLRLVVSPLSSYFSKKKELANMIAMRFYQIFTSEIRGKEHEK